MGPQVHFKNKNIISKKNLIGTNFQYLSLGKKNKNKIFYIINRSPGAGLFSNLTFIINHLKICEQFNFIPIIDMENFTTIYNEKEKIDSSYNAWDYYFKKLNKYNLKEIYKSKNLILTSSKFQPSMYYNMLDKKIKNNLNKIKLKKKFYFKANNFYKKNFNKNDKILGVHFRGSTYKTARRHAFPPTLEIMIKTIDHLIKKKNYTKFFLVTEESNYLKIIKKKFGNKCIYFPSYRMEKIDSFQIYPRKKHRFKLGEEIIIETLLLSKCHGLTYVKSNVISAAKMFSKIKQKDYELFMGYNSWNKYISRWLWYLKLYLPFLFGKIKLIKKIQTG